QGEQDSVMRSFYRSGQPMEEGSFAKGSKQGPWTYFYPDGNKMLTEQCDKDICLSMDAWDRDGTQTLTKGEGLVRTYYPSGDTADVSHYHWGVRSGEQREYWPAGNLKAKGNWLGGVRHGLWEYWYSTAVPERTETWSMGKLDGPFTSWFTTGKVNVTGFHAEGLKD